MENGTVERTVLVGRRCHLDRHAHPGGRDQRDRQRDHAGQIPGGQRGGNTGTGVTVRPRTTSTVRPTATIVVADSALSVGETSLVTITFSEAVTWFTNADLTAANGTLSAVSSSDGGTTWTATFTWANTTAASNVITLGQRRGRQRGGNTGSGTTDSNNSRSTPGDHGVVVVADTARSQGRRRW